MVNPINRHALQNDIQPRPNQGCCASLKNLIKKIGEAVAVVIRDLLVRIQGSFAPMRKGLERLGCLRARPVVVVPGGQNPLVPMVVHPRPPVMPAPVVPVVELPAGGGIAPIINLPLLDAVQPMPNAPPIAQIGEVDLDPLRRAIEQEWGRELRDNQPFLDIQDRLVPQNFLTLLDEYPNKLALIGSLAIAWGKTRSIKIDPYHPFFELFQNAFKYKNELDRGAEPVDYRTYELAPNNNKYYDNPKFRYTIYSLMGFQELTRPDHREMVRRLDNGARRNNPGYEYATAVSKIFTYPTGDQVLDIPDKLNIGIDAPWRIYQTGKAYGKVLEYFRDGFNNGYCFDARLSDLQRYCEPLITDQDFNPDIGTGSTIAHKVLEYFRVFQNKQLIKYSIEKNLNYKDLQYWVRTGAVQGGLLPDRNGRRLGVQERERIHQAIIDFYRQLCTADHFANFLQENKQPIKQGEQPIDRAEWEGLLDGNFEP